MGKKKFNDYYIGLDIGTDSVGWAVTDTDYRVMKFNGKAMWGSRLFPEAETAADRRSHRIARRRLERRKQRLALLQDVFSEEIGKIDPGFFKRLQEGGLHQEDKTIHQPYNLFSDSDFNDSHYHKKYPTIYHLRKELSESSQSHDIRLVYLAIHHIIKYRGHFLFGSDLHEVPDLSDILNDFSRELEDTCGVSLKCTDIDRLRNILTSNYSMTQRQKQLLDVFEVSTKQQKAILKAITGGSVSLKDLFDLSESEENTLKVDFSSDKYDENLDEYSEKLGENFYVLEKMKAIYDWSILERVCPGGKSISCAKVDVYEKHRSDLSLLKKVIKRYLPGSNNRIFHSASVPGNYASYAGCTRINGKKLPVKRCTIDEFKKLITKEINSSEVDASDPDVILLKDRLNSADFLPKSVVKDNGVLPYQLHRNELESILSHASRYLPFLSLPDPDGITPCEKILQIHSFRIPYYVGPLNDRNPHAQNCWVVRRSHEKIYPWNFEEIVDLEKSAQNFITRMTSSCTYLRDADVLPKNSILYSKFMVLNELNNLRIKGEPVSIEVKQDIYNDLFLTRSRVTNAMLCKYYRSKYAIEISKDDITGIDVDFHSSLRPMLEMKKALGLSYTEEIAEDFIYNATVFGDSQDMYTKRMLKRYRDKIDPSIIRKATLKHFSGWGRFSKEFLTQLLPVFGEQQSIIEMMWCTNNNLMQLLSTQYGYVEAVRKYNSSLDADEQTGYRRVRDLYVSPAVKRAIWQALCIVDEIRKITRHDPLKIFVEMARGPEEVKQRKDSRKKTLIDLYKACAEETRDWISEIDARDESDYRSDRLYLYYTQMGKCMYTGEPIDISRLFDQNIYDIDHILPQSKVKDDSINNRVLVKRSVNAEKTDIYPLHHDIRNRMRSFWAMLLEKKLISREKYERLTRSTALSNDELLSFISRQLVETRQSTKAVAELLRESMPDSEVVYVKAGLVSDFRHNYDMLKCREVNDLHHAKDAYLNIVVGNVYNTKFTHDPRIFFSERDTRYSLNAMFNFDVIRNGVYAWHEGDSGSIATVKHMMAKNNPLVTNLSFEQHGAIADTMLKPKGEWQLPQKKNSFFNDPTKYGGYNKVKGAYFILVEHTEKGRRIRSLVDMPLYLADKASTPTEVAELLALHKGLINPHIIFPRIKIGALIEIDGFRMTIAGRTGNQIVYAPAQQLILGYNAEKYVRNIMKFCDRYSEYSKRHPGGCLSVREQDLISAEENISLYDTLEKKLETTSYGIRLKAQKNNMKEKRDTFINLTVQMQCIILKELLKMFSCDRRTSDLRSIGLGGQVGAISTSKRISDYKTAFLVNQSITGLFESRVDLQK